MRHTRLAAVAVAACTLVASIPTAASAQGWLDHVKQKAKETVQQRTDQATDSVTNAAFDKAEHVVKCVAGDKQCIKNAQAAGQSVAVVNAQGQPVSTADSAKAIAAATGATGSLASAAPAGPGIATAAPSDFKAGDQLITAPDFSATPPGDFPRNLTLVNGNMEVAVFNGQKLLRASDHSDFRVPLPTVLPQRFTLEFDYTGSEGWSMEVHLNPDAEGNAPTGTISFGSDGSADIAPHQGAESKGNVGSEFSGQLMHCAVMADSDYVKLYINGIRVAQSPNAPLGRTNFIELQVTASQSEPAFIGNIRVAAGGRDMYQALSTDGRFTTHGILFATGSAAIDPSSASTLSQIGQMLQQHPDLKLEIDGHTDNVGSAASNMTLSDQRAASVKQYLVSNFQIDPSRLASKGFGATKPVAPNTTDDGRSQNRRVELVKM